ncbi:uncharacterized protein LOC114532036 [Dendronephthya gigantea]|uniref:uncharacterized protein LOC114532036 n=1 Tax=Dendronephthya gigantea TaxID=151771 RepID=UPI00106A674A|nr:uncharacterized protein LOC114532036 [Dendronephthya gigantea]
MATFRDKLTNYGNEFVVGFTSLYRSASGGQIGIAIVAHFDTNITIKTESVTKSLNVTFHMKEGEFLKYNLPLSLRMNGKQSNGVLVSSTKNISVTCLDYRYSSYGGDGYLALPTYALGIIYVVASYQPYDYYSRAKIGIVASHERTNVLFKLNKNAVIVYNGISYNYGSPFHISLSKLQTVQLESRSDLSGSMIFASKPITVISTVDLGRPGSGNSDKLATLLLPVTQWGKQYILTTVGSMSHQKGDIFRVFAYENNTVVKNAYGSQLLSSGTYTELILDKNLTSFINCSKRCQVVQYIIGKTIGGRYADPSMIVLPSIKQYLPYYRVMASYASTYFSSVTITIEKRYTNGLYFDEVQMSNLTWLKVTGTNYVWAVVGMAGTKVATVYHSSPAVKFGLLVFGWYYSDSYAYPGGFGLHHFYTSGQEQANQMASKTATFTDKVTNYGMEFVVGFTSLYRSKSGGQIGIAIVAHFDTNITIKTESVTKSLNVTFHMKEGEFLKYNLPLSLRMNGKQRNGVLVSSTEKFHVDLGRPGSGNSDKLATLLLPVTHFYHIIVLASYASTYFSSVTITIEKRYTNGLYFDEVQMSNLTWLKVTGTNYVWTVVGMAGTKVAIVYHSSPAVKFGLLVFGWYYSDSYAYPGGFALDQYNKRQEQAHKVASKMATFRDKLTNYGNEFVVGFTSLYRSASGGQIGIAIVAHFDTNITIKTESVTKSLNVTFHMKEGEFLKYNLPLSLRMNGKQSNGVLVSSTKNISVTCLDYRYSSYGGDGYLALPTYALGIIYVVASYQPYDYYSRAKIGIVASHERTNVLFKLNKNAVIVYNGISYNYGSPFHISLSKLQTVQLESRSDLSGSMIFASKPITVISTVDLGRPGSGNSDKATLLLPVTQWGKQYILTTVGSMSHQKGDIFRVFAYENNTVVKNAYGSQLLSSGTYTELILDKNLTSFINCSKRCQVVQYIIGKTIGGRYADPSMIVLPSIKQYLPYYRVMASYASTYFSSVTITIEKRYTNGLYFDEVQMSNLTWLKVTGTNYVWAVVGMAGTKVATVYHSSPAVKFGLLVFGWYYSDSYAYPGGFGLHHFYTSGQEQANQMASKTATFTDKVTNYGMEFVVGFTSLYRSKSGGQIGIAIVAHFDTNITIKTESVTKSLNVTFHMKEGEFLKYNLPLSLRMNGNKEMACWFHQQRTFQ